MSEIPIYANFDKGKLDKLLPKAKEEAENTYGDDEPEGYLFPELELNPDSEFYFDEEKMAFVVSGQLFQKNEEIGYLSFNVPIDIDIVNQIIDYYRKVLGKIKTVLEATK